MARKTKKPNVKFIRCKWCRKQKDVNEFPSKYHRICLRCKKPIHFTRGKFIISFD